MNNKDAVCAFCLSSNLVLEGVEVGAVNCVVIGGLYFCFLGGGGGCCADGGGGGVLNTEGFVFKLGGIWCVEGGGGGSGSCVCEELSVVKSK